MNRILLAGIVARIPSALWELGGAVKAGNVNLVFAILALLMYIVIIGFVVYEQ